MTTKLKTTATKSEMQLCGVYEIVNLVNGKRYVGSAADSFVTRWTRHASYLRRGTHHCRYLQAAWIKYGEASFEFRIAEVTRPEHAVGVEQTFIDFRVQEGRKAIYNTALFSWSNLGTKRSEAVKSKMRNSQLVPSVLEGHRERTRLRMSDPVERAEMIEKVREANSRPAVKAAIGEKSRLRWSRPEYREEMCEKMRQRWANMTQEKKSEIGSKIRATLAARSNEQKLEANSKMIAARQRNKAEKNSKNQIERKAE